MGSVTYKPRIKSQESVGPKRGFWNLLKDLKMKDDK